MSLPQQYGVWHLQKARDQHTGLFQAANKLSQTTLQPIKMPHISPQELEKPRKKRARKTGNGIQLAIPTSKSCHDELREMPRLPIGATAISCMTNTWGDRVRKKKRSGQGVFFQNIRFIYLFVLFLYILDTGKL